MNFKIQPKSKLMSILISIPLSILVSMRNQIAALIAFCAIITVSGCAYRFTNLHIQQPKNIKSIAIEAVYDTSREVLPHEVIWEELQQAFARDGHLQVASRKNADALLRVHITKAAVGPSGEIHTRRPNEEDPKVFDGGEPPSFNRFRRLPYAGEARRDMTLAIVMQVEVWHLESKELLLDRIYNLSESFKAVRPSGLPDATGFLRTEESMYADVARVSRQASESIVQDLLVR